MTTRRKLADLVTAAYVEAFNVVPKLPDSVAPSTVREPISRSVFVCVDAAARCDTLLRHIARSRAPHGPPEYAEGCVAVNVRAHLRKAYDALCGLAAIERNLRGLDEHCPASTYSARLGHALEALETAMRRSDTLVAILDDEPSSPRPSVRLKWGELRAVFEVPPDTIADLTRRNAITATTARALIGDTEIERWRAAIGAWETADEETSPAEIKRRLGWIYAM